MKELRVFVYGTLKPGYVNYDRYCRDCLLNAQPAKVRGDLYHFPQLGHPGMSHGTQWVQGYLLTLKDDGDILRKLDLLEEYNPDNPDSFYLREQTEVFSPDDLSLGQAWAYWMTLNTVQMMHGISVHSGYWSL